MSMLVQSSMSRTLPMPFYSLVSGLKSGTLDQPLDLVAAHRIPPLALGCRRGKCATTAD